MQRPDRANACGYTLIEIMIVVVIACMMLAIAIPGYQGYTQRARNDAAIAGIGELHLALKRWETNNGSFPATLAAAGLDGYRDPWGQPYRYLLLQGANIGSARKDRNLVPINTDYDLYSVGQDGETSAPLTAGNSRDDIIRANNGAFIGMAADY